MQPPFVLREFAVYRRSPSQRPRDDLVSTLLYSPADIIWSLGLCPSHACLGEAWERAREPGKLQAFFCLTEIEAPEAIL